MGEKEGTQPPSEVFSLGAQLHELKHNLIRTKFQERRPPAYVSYVVSEESLVLRVPSAPRSEWTCCGSIKHHWGSPHFPQTGMSPPLSSCVTGDSSGWLGEGAESSGFTLSSRGWVTRLPHFRESSQGRPWQ